MAVFLLLVALLTVAVWALRWHLWQRRLEKRVAGIPGPRSWPFVGCVPELDTNPENLYNTGLDLVKKYGPVLRIWLGPMLFVSLYDPNDIQVFLSSSKYIDKGKTYAFMKPIFGSGLITASGERWRKNRKLLTPAFHVRVLEHFLDVIDGKSHILVNRLKKETNGQSFDIYPYMVLYAIDEMIETAMGVDVNTQADPEPTLANAAEVALGTVWKRMISPWLYPDVIYKMSSTGKKQRKAQKILSSTVHNIIRKKRKEIITKEKRENEERNGAQNRKRHTAFLDLLLQENATGGTFTDQDMQEEVATFLIAGYETTATALSFTLWLLSIHQATQDKVYNEVKSLLSNTTEPKMKILNEMKYLEAVIKESMRLYAPVPLIARQIKEDFVTKDGITIPADTTVVIPIAVVHKNPDFYAEPEEFIPERFLDNGSNSLNAFAFIPFSAGPRNCIGQKLAMLSMKSAISKILMRYELLPDPEFKPHLSVQISMKSLNGIKLKICPRGNTRTENAYIRQK